jgi:hypothetical protein
MQRLIRLPEGEGRCSPFHLCEQKIRCARYRAVPVPGVPLGDHSKAGGDPACVQFLPLPDADHAP